TTSKRDWSSDVCSSDLDYYFTGQLALIDAVTGAVTKVGAPAVIDRADPAPGGGFILVVRTVRPYSFLVTADLFPKSIEIWTVQRSEERRVGKECILQLG